jgi:predicted NACHT family NTPase
MQSSRKKRNLSKFTLLQCLERYYKNDHDQAVLLTEFIWKEKDKINLEWSKLRKNDNISQGAKEIGQDEITS